MTPSVSRGFHGRRRPVADPSRIPPGQYLTTDFPVLSAGPTPHTPLEEWGFTIHGEVEEPVSWPWEEFLALPSETVDRRHPLRDQVVQARHDLDGRVGRRAAGAGVHLGGVRDRLVDGGYTTNLALGDVTDGKAWIAYEYDGRPIEAEHGGPARLLVPHLYFWKSAKWVRGLTLTADDEPGFWENYGYHNHGDPWLEQRYQGD